MVGKNVKLVTVRYPEFNFAPTLSLLKYAFENRKPISVRTQSNCNLIDIDGYPLADCYCITMRDVVEQRSLIAEIRRYLKKENA
jgi:hypothetical protein